MSKAFPPELPDLYNLQSDLSSSTPPVSLTFTSLFLDLFSYLTSLFTATQSLLGPDQGFNHFTHLKMSLCWESRALFVICPSKICTLNSVRQRQHHHLNKPTIVTALEGLPLEGLMPKLTLIGLILFL